MRILHSFCWGFCVYAASQVNVTNTVLVVREFSVTVSLLVEVRICVIVVSYSLYRWITFYWSEFILLSRFVRLLSNIGITLASGRLVFSKSWALSQEALEWSCICLYNPLDVSVLWLCRVGRKTLLTHSFTHSQFLLIHCSIW